MQFSKDLFGSDGLAELQKVFCSGKCLLALDFDGTLAPIVSNPELAKMSLEVETQIKELATRVEILILTGRSYADIRSRIPKEVRHVIANHGIEGNRNVSEKALFDAKKIVKKWVSVLSNSQVNRSEFVVEDKDYSLTFHFRSALNEDLAREHIRDLVSSLLPVPTMFDGKFCINVIPPGLPDKYVAIDSFMDDFGFENAVFIGDDITDNKVFIAQDSRIFCIKVGVSPQLAAPWFIEDQTSISKILRYIIDLLDCNLNA